MTSHKQQKPSSIRSKAALGEILKPAKRGYAAWTPLRVAIRAVRHVGPAIDLVLSEHSSALKEKRIQMFLATLDRRLCRIERLGPLDSSEEFHDFIVLVLDSVVRSRSATKIQRFANAVANQTSRREPWDDVEIASKLLADLTDTHIDVLATVIGASSGTGVFEGVKVAVVRREDNAKGQVVTIIEDELLSRRASPINTDAIRLACVQLVASGLLHDEGPGRASTPAMKFFVATDLGRWFMGWISDNATDEPPVPDA